MLSRVADSIYWMARYVERAENLARFVDVTLNLMLDLPPGSAEQWQPLVSTTGDSDYFARRHGTANQANTIHFLTFDRDYANSVLSCLIRARENARSVRETIASEMWEQLNAFYHFVRDAAEREESLAAPSEFFEEIKRQAHLFRGVTDSILTHGEGWHFLRLGQLIERADKTSRILDVKSFFLLPRGPNVDSSIDDLQWSSVLRSVSGFEMYRKKYGALTPRDIIDFLVLDAEFPRAIQYCVIEAEGSLHQISGTPPGKFRNAVEKRMGRLHAELAYTQVDEIFQQGLHGFLDGLQQKLNAVGEAINETFFALRPVDTSARVL
jgi:uncharacterized alpha-E superfamily protein